jgi:hypothetical protein
MNDLGTLKKLLDDKTIVQYNANCVRQKSNFSKSGGKYRFDNINFKPNKLLKDIPTHSPKLGALLRKIHELDAKDTMKYGHTFKHFIFSDLKSSAYGAKLIASALIAKGMTLGYTSSRLHPNESYDSEEDDDESEVEDESSPKRPAGRKEFGPIELLDDDTLLNTKGNNFYLLASTSVYEKPISVKMKKAILSKFNERPTNVIGELARIIVMDSGFKEGIDLFDIKYIHVFEPSVNSADQKQVIGRGTRTCGQKGLDFHPRYGWPLHVFVYDLSIPDEYRDTFLGSKTTFELYMKALNVDVRLLNFGYDIERLTVLGSVDYDLNKNIHHFSIEPNEEGDDEELFGGEAKKKSDKKVSPKTLKNIQNATENIQFIDLRKKPEGYERRKGDIFIYDKKGHIKSISSHSTSILPSPSNSPIDNILRRYPEIPPLPKIGRVIMGHEAMKNYIDSEFKQFTWDVVKMENQCIPKGGKLSGGKKPELIDYTPTQNFIKHYFTPTAPVKGMLLWHSVGTGKTCSAIAAASSSFEAQGYTILWVTRTTLKNDIWKNMFSQVCNENIRKKILEIEKAGDEFPDEQDKQMRMLSHSWRIRPISYKQFSNLVSKQNDYYKRLVKENGEEDPLRKTLLIIDEAHKLYGGGDLSSIERPDMVALHDSLMRSYAISGKDSVRLMLMTATPITESPIEIIQLVNLCKPLEEQMPSSFEEFSDHYLDIRGEFTDQGKDRYLDEIAGHISYLNREKDARQFAQPIIHHINVPIVSDKKLVDDYDIIALKESSMRSILDKKEELEKVSKKMEGDLKGINAKSFSHLLQTCENRDKKSCEKIVKRNIKYLVIEAKAYLKTIKEQVVKIRHEYEKLNKSKTQHTNRIREHIEKNPDAFNRYKESAYYTLRQVCSTKIRTNEEFEKHIEEDAEIEKYNQEIKDYEIRIQEMENSLKTMVQAYRIRIGYMKKLLSDSDLSHIERSVVRATIRDEERGFKFIQREQTKKNREAIENLKEEIKESKYGKKERISELRKTIKLRYKVEKKERNEINKVKTKLHVELRNKRKIGFTDSTIQDLIEVYKEKINEQLDDYVNIKTQSDRKNQEAKCEKLQKKEEEKKLKQEKREQEKEEKRQTRKRESDAKKQAKMKEKEKERERKMKEKEDKRKTKKNK